MVDIDVAFKVKHLKKCMYFRVTSIACFKLTTLYINYTTIIFIPVVQKHILYILLPVRRIN